MISEEMLAEYAKKAAIQMNVALPKPEDCSHRYSPDFSRKIGLIHSRKKAVPHYTLKAAAACLLLIFLLGAESAVLLLPAAREETIRLVAVLPLLFGA